METIGEYLRRHRQERGLTVDEVAGKTRIAPNYVRALEENRLNEFPGEVFARGFVIVYGRCLGLDEKETLARFSEGARAFFREQSENKKTAREKAENARIREKRKNHAVQLILIGIMGLAILGVYWINTKKPDLEETVTEAELPHPPVIVRPVPVPIKPRPEFPSDPAPLAQPKPESPAPPSIAPNPVEAIAKPETPNAPGAPSEPSPPPIARSTPFETILPLPPVPPAVNLPGQPARPAPSAPIPAPPAGELVLVIEAVESSWVSAQIDDGITKVVFLEMGNTVTWKAAKHFRASFGNAGGVRLTLNGKPLAPFGPSGAVVKDVMIK